MPPVERQRTKILRWWDGRVLWEGDGTLPEVLAAAVEAGADLTGASLDGARLDGASLEPIQDDLYAVLAAAPREVPGLLEALRQGRIDGSTYSGECACLVGTVAKLRGCEYTAVDGLVPNSNRPAERWFLAIRPGDTPATSQVSAITTAWVEEWLAARPQER